ncbi:unnamed protein product [Gulo gulo]|uniref:Uncharacterized protein n=1 Tax=Gulo gulo TaxID=48420 RepID=A0A9X9LGL7_GULGU|nr:unnamed protein product [Gulo gulo]
MAFPLKTEPVLVNWLVAPGTPRCTPRLWVRAWAPACRALMSGKTTALPTWWVPSVPGHLRDTTTLPRPGSPTAGIKSTSLQPLCLHL